MDCKSATGLMVGLVDAILLQATLLNAGLREQPQLAPEIVEALRDLCSDPDLKALIELAKTV